MKIVSQKAIFDVVKKGGKIRWDSMNEKAHLLDVSGAIVGSIRFDTYLKMTKYTWFVEKIDSDFRYDYYGTKPVR